jgi:hypothetical protein
MSTSADADGGDTRSSVHASVDLAQLRAQGTAYVSAWRARHGTSSCSSVYIPLDRIDLGEAVHVARQYAAFVGNASKLVVKNEKTIDLAKQVDLYARVGTLVAAFPRVSTLQLDVAAIGVDVGAFLTEVNKLENLEHLEFMAWRDAKKESRLASLALLSAFVERRHADPARASLKSLTVVSSLVPLGKDAFAAFCTVLRNAHCECFKLHVGQRTRIC